MVRVARAYRQDRLKAAKPPRESIFARSEASFSALAFSHRVGRRASPFGGWIDVERLAIILVDGKRKARRMAEEGGEIRMLSPNWLSPNWLSPNWPSPNWHRIGVTALGEP